MINYQENAKTGSITVKLYGKIVGDIRKVAGGYQYFPKGQKEGGTVCTSLASCKRELECE